LKILGYEIEKMVVPAPARKFYFRCVSNLGSVKPRYHVLVKEALHYGLGEVKQIIHSEHCLHQAMFSERKTVRRGFNFKSVRIPIPMHTEAVERHVEQLLSLGSAEIAPGQLQVTDRMTVIR